MKMKKATKTDNKLKYKLSKLSNGHAQRADIMYNTILREFYIGKYRNNV